MSILRKAHVAVSDLRIKDVALLVIRCDIELRPLPINLY